MALVDRQQWVAYELLSHHPGALDHLGIEEVERLGEGMAEWGSVDAFGCLVSGPAWRRGRLPDEAVHRWAASADRWWRRAALVSTVPLNLRSRGGTGDTGRTLDICRRLATDGDDMVIKALSWALRELVVWDPQAVRGSSTTTRRCSRLGSGARSVASWRPAASTPPGVRPDLRSGQPGDRVSRRMSRK
jgi:3-methyladenine DNA glycosylase AlkD